MNGSITAMGSEKSPSASTIESSSATRRFDAYMFLDWSANNRPKTGKDSIWIAEAWFDDDVISMNERNCCNPRTRKGALEVIERQLHTHLQHGRRVLICFDFPYCYPQCAQISLLGASAREIWGSVAREIEDSDANRSNRFHVASNLNEKFREFGLDPLFWGKPHKNKDSKLAGLSVRKHVLEAFRQVEFRAIESTMRTNGLRPFSVWQLLGAGSVSSQALLGMAYLHRLLDHPDFASVSQVWPFDKGWALSEKPQIVHAEFWPGAIVVDLSVHAVRDAAQVLSCVRWAASQDANGNLLSFFSPQVVKSKNLQASEGWILGYDHR